MTAPFSSKPAPTRRGKTTLSNRNPDLRLGAIRPEYWLGGVTALSILVFLAPSVQTGLAALVYVAALFATKDLICNFLILDEDDHQIGAGTRAGALAFATIYLTGMILCALT